MDVVELGAHQAPEDPAAAMCRQDSDERHACSANEPTGHAGLERKRRAAPDDDAVVECGVDALSREQTPEPLDEVGVGLAAEVVEDRRDHVGKLLRRGRPDLEAQPKRSSGA